MAFTAQRACEFKVRARRGIDENAITLPGALRRRECRTHTQLRAVDIEKHRGERDGFSARKTAEAVERVQSIEIKNALFGIGGIKPIPRQRRERRATITPDGT